MEKVMFKKLLLIAGIVSLTACSSFNKKIDGTDSVTSEFMGGEIKITYNKDGQFESMQASGASRVTSTLPSAREDAFIVAKMRAQQKMVEFMKNELESELFKKTVYDSLQEGQNTGGQDANEVNSKITRNLTEEIKTKQRAILKGVHIESKKFDTSTNTVLVVVKTGTKEISTAKTVYTLMGN
jgi:hypothetical protein